MSNNKFVIFIKVKAYKMLDLNQLTLGQLKEISNLVGGVKQNSEKNHPFVGLFVIARCYSAGVHSGYVDSVDGENVILSKSRRLWKWMAVDGLALSAVAQNGLKLDESKIDALNPLIYLTGVCELIPASKKCEESLNV